jgi:selenocysteine-specific elongation factor
VIVATAGHVDHGKTSLIRALTGVDTDGLPEERRRGMSIDLGFAYLPLPGQADPSGVALGFVDVPGHVDFIRNALAGLGAVEAGLAVVAADDGPMPQTREHLSALDLLGIPVLAVALTKVDRVDSARVAQSVEAIRRLPGVGAAARVFPVASPTGQGVDALKSHLFEQAAAHPARSAGGNFRLAVDRCFSVAGAGLVVTGTVVSGRLETGAPVRLLQAGRDARVRGMRVHGAPASECRAGQRAALNLSGPQVRREDIRRGEWVTTGDVPAPQRRLDARLRVELSRPKPLAHWSAVHVHLGAAHASARLALLEGQQIEPGQDALVQLVLDQPLAAVTGDRFLIRDAAAQATLGGGRIVDVFPPPRGRARPERLAQLRAMEAPDAATRLVRLLADARAGVALEPLRQSLNLTETEASAAFDPVPAVRLRIAQGPLAFSLERWTELEEAVLRNLRAAHEASPERVGPPADRILQGSSYPLSRETVLAIAAKLASDGTVRKRGMAVCLPSHEPRLEGEDQTLWEQLYPLLAEGGQRPPTIHELSYALRLPPARIASVLGRAAQCGQAVRVSPRHFYLPAALADLAARAQCVAAGAESGFTAAQFRDQSGLGRNLTIELLEFFDRVRYTRRIGDRHILLAPAEAVFGPPGP